MCPRRSRSAAASGWRPSCAAVSHSAVERPLDGGAVAACADGLDAADLLALQCRVDPEDRCLVVVALEEVVDADDDPLLRVDLGLELERGVGDLALRVVRLTASTIPPSSSILAKYSYARASISSVSASTKYEPPKRVDRVRHAGLVRDHLLRPQRDPDGVLCRQRERLVIGVGVQ